MKVVVQRVAEARVDVGGETVGEIGPGLLVLAGIEPEDGDTEVRWMAEKLIGLRIFADDARPMNRSVADTGGGLLLVSQFTLAADTSRGRRPSFTSAAPPEHAEAVFERLVAACRERHAPVATGAFGADMQVRLVNDGPVTFLLETP